MAFVLGWLGGPKVDTNEALRLKPASKARRRDLCAFCGDRVSEERAHGALYCSDRCRKNAWVARHYKAKPEGREVKSMVRVALLDIERERELPPPRFSREAS